MIQLEAGNYQQSNQAQIAETLLRTALSMNMPLAEGNREQQVKNYNDVNQGIHGKENRAGEKVRDRPREWSAVRPLTILLVEDSQADAVSVRRSLKNYMDRPFELYHVLQMVDAEALLKNPAAHIDIILLDLLLPDTKDGLDTYSRIRNVAGDLPVIVLTGYADHDVALKIVEQGAEDYVRKSVMVTNPVILRDVIEFSMTRCYNKEAYKKRKESELAEKEHVIHWLSGGYSVDNGKKE